MSMKSAMIIVLFLTIANCCFAQADPLFSTDTPLNIALTLSVREIRKTKEDSVFKATTMYYQNESGSMDSIHVGLKGRGNSRMELCHFPPLWIKISKKNAKGTVFAGNKKLKLVVPCNKPTDNNDFILKEYLCYKLYEVVTPLYFKTRLANLDMTEVWKDKRYSFKQKAIFIEDADNTAARHNSKLLKNAKVSPALLQDTATLRFDLFQFMISNTDWSKQFQHNTKLIYLNNKAIAIPYDFDMSGLVNAPYAVVSEINGEQLPIANVRQRYYRGVCQSKDLTEFVRKEFISKEAEFMAVPDKLKGQLPDKRIESVKKYLADFFDVLKNDGRFNREIANNCQEL